MSNTRLEIHDELRNPVDDAFYFLDDEILHFCDDSFLTNKERRRCHTFFISQLARRELSGVDFRYEWKRFRGSSLSCRFS